MVVVGVILVGILFGLIGGLRDPMGSPEMLERA
jgi:hypothetical protein